MSIQPQCTVTRHSRRICPRYLFVTFDVPLPPVNEREPYTAPVTSDLVAAPGDHMTLRETFGTRLIFAGRPPGEFVRPSTLTRIREPVSRSKSGVQGKVADVRHGCSRHAESQNEIRAYRILIATARADEWQEQPFTVEYHMNGQKRRYTPDALVAWGSHQEVVEIKADREAELIENQERFRVIGELLIEYGYHFRLWKQSEICAEPRLTNVGLVLRYRCDVVPAAERERIRRAYSAVPEWGAQEVCKVSDVSIQSVLRLVLDGTLHIDWWEPLTLGSRVSRVPIGRQVWPCAPLLSAPSEECRCHTP